MSPETAVWVPKRKLRPEGAGHLNAKKEEGGRKERDSWKVKKCTEEEKIVLLVKIPGRATSAYF